MLYVQTAMLFVACDDAGVLQFILTHAAGEPGDTLAEVTGFQYVMARAKKDAGDVPPQIRWFVEPLGYMQISQLENPERKPTRGKTRIEIFKNQGLDGFQAAGGFVHVNLDGFPGLAPHGGLRPQALPEVDEAFRAAQPGRLPVRSRALRPPRRGHL